ncbi:hypothetical protein TTHERM_00046710 (macronuclear) [Tetrahymena thermophila SB210]|uniref:Uncharacterized protein n=1 Tax=Tetrahymena thermophila (strain SB210) TaxID=312017 RepID=Q23DM0_TETTS|nr:hypothetical protein TTHERM_00046710 [Tetrahymena thermophila SB210]EAR94497.2 hypothetical protein TTHERM_00046710 [Tetrahymena thermophila SB210]|eukprot:XP_001014666.2 hypothetical protein TTHERM_00046710 [Tetrahymena thermophila SB210]
MSIKESFKQARSKSYATQKQAAENIGIQRGSVLFTKEFNNSQIFKQNNNNYLSQQPKAIDLIQKKRNQKNSIGFLDSAETQPSTRGNTFYHKSHENRAMEKNNSQPNVKYQTLQQTIPTGNLTTQPDSIYESVEAIYPEFKKKVLLKRQAQKTEYEKDSEEAIQRFKTEMYQNDKFLYKSQQQLREIEEKEQYELFKKEIEIQQKILKNKEDLQKSELQVKQWPNIWKMVRHFQETQAQDVADMLKTKDFLDEFDQQFQNQKQISENAKQIQGLSELKKNKGYAHATISSSNLIKTLQNENNPINKNNGNKQKQNIQSFLEKECKKAKMMAEELEIQQIFRNGINTENANTFSDVNKINTKIKKYCKLIRPKGASLSSKVEQKFVDNNMKYFLISSTIDIDQTQKIMFKQQFEKNKTLTNNFGNSSQVQIQSKVMQEFQKQNLNNKNNDDYLNDNVILFPTEIDQILQSQEYQDSPKSKTHHSNQKQGNFLESIQQNNLQQTIQEENIYENLSTPPSNTERRISIPKIVNGRITLEVKRFIKKNLPQTKHFVHYRQRKDKRSISMNTHKFPKYDDQEAHKLDLTCTREQQRSININKSVNDWGSQFRTINSSSYHQRSTSVINSRQDLQRSQMQSRQGTSVQLKTEGDQNQQFFNESQSKINEILLSCAKVKNEKYNDEIEREEYSQKRTAKDVIKAMEKLRDNKTEKIKTKLLNQSELIEKNDIEMLGEGQKVLNYLEDQIVQSNWGKKIQNQELEYKKDLIRQKMLQSQNGNVIKASQVSQIHKKKLEKNKIQQKCFIQSQEKQLSKYINFADYIGYK